MPDVRHAVGSPPLVTSAPARIGVAHEYDLLRRGIAGCLREDPHFSVVFEIAGGEPPTLAEVVVASPQALESAAYDCPIVLCVADASQLPGRQDGFAAVLPWAALTATQLRASVLAVAEGFHVDLQHGQGPAAATGVDERGLKVLRLLAQGATTRSISEELFYSERTVKSIIRDVELELSAATRAQAVAEALRRGLI